MSAIIPSSASAQNTQLSPSTSHQDKYIKTLFDEIRTSISQSEEYAQTREAISLALDELHKTGHLVGKGTDAEHRPVFVGLQAVIENVLSIHLQERTVTHLSGVIHTPMPTTPLCTEVKAQVTTALAHDSIVNDPNRRQTIVSRAQIVREFLTRGGALYVAYPKGGLEKRTEEQQKIYNAARLTFYIGLVDIQLEKDLPTDMVGATYVVKTKDGNKLFFAIKASQANAPKTEDQAWELWLGTLEQHRTRYEHVLNTLVECGGLNLRTEFSY